MNNVQISLQKNGEGIFNITEGNEQIAKMEISVRGNVLTVYHTEVAEKAEGKGYAKQLMAAMVEYAKTNKLKVKALCPFVHSQFLAHPEEFAAVEKLL